MFTALRASALRSTAVCSTLLTRDFTKQLVALSVAAAKFVLFGIVAWLRCGIVGIVGMVGIAVVFMVFYFCFLLLLLHYCALYALAVCFACCSTCLPLNFYFGCHYVRACVCVWHE